MLLDNGTTWLAGKLFDTATAGRTFTYQRAGSTIATITGTRSVDEEPAIGADGITNIIVRQHSLSFHLADLGSDPRPGDRIAETIGGTVTNWEVMPHAGDACWQWEDASGIIARVFVKQVQ